MNNRGSILTVTLGFVLIFSLLGVALLRHATVQNETTERRTHSVESLWIADAAVELARHNLAKATPDLINVGDPDSIGTLGQGNYNVYSESDRCHCYQDKEEAKQCYSLDPNVPQCAGPHPVDRWHIRSQALMQKYDVDGSTLDENRGIDAVVASYDISNAITTHGTVNYNPSSDCQPWGAAQIAGGCEPHVDFTFETIFNGMTFSDFIAKAAANPIPNTHPIYDPDDPLDPLDPVRVNHVFHLTPSYSDFRVHGVTVIYFEGNFNTLSIDTEDANVYISGTPSVLIVDTGYDGSGSVPKVDFTGSTREFCGIVWIIGKVKITGNSVIKGAVFVDEYPSSDTTITGTPDVIFSPQCVEDAINGFGGTGAPGLIAWKEFAL